MANIKGKKEIKANITSESIVINATIAQNTKKIQSNPTTLPTATTERKGIIRIATDEEALAGELNNVAITPHTLELKTTTFVFEQAIASDTWVINHNLNKCPSVTVVDSAGTQFLVEVEYNDLNTITLYMNGDTKGKAYLN